MEKSHWCSCPALPYFLPTVNRQPHVPRSPTWIHPKCQCTEMIFMVLGCQLFIWVHVDTFLAHTFLLFCFPQSLPPVFSIISLPPPVFPIWSYHWQYCNLWKEARYDTHLVELSPRPAVQEVRVTGGTSKQAHQLGWRMTRGPEAFLYCRNVTKTLARHIHGCTMVQTKETDREKLWGGGRAEYYRN